MGTGQGALKSAELHSWAGGAASGLSALILAGLSVFLCRYWFLFFIIHAFICLFIYLRVCNSLYNSDQP